MYNKLSAPLNPCRALRNMWTAHNLLRLLTSTCGAHLLESGDRRIPADECVQQSAGVDVPQLKASLPTSEEDEVLEAARVEHSRNGKPLGVKGQLAVLDCSTESSWVRQHAT